MEMTQNKIHCKAQLGDDIRRFAFEGGDIKFNVLLTSIRKIFDLPSDVNVIVKYLDDEKDQITVSSDAEISLAVRCNSLLRLTLVVDEQRANADCPTIPEWRCKNDWKKHKFHQKKRNHHDKLSKKRERLQKKLEYVSDVEKRQKLERKLMMIDHRMTRFGNVQPRDPRSVLNHKFQKIREKYEKHPINPKRAWKLSIVNEYLTKLESATSDNEVRELKKSFKSELLWKKRDYLQNKYETLKKQNPEKARKVAWKLDQLSNRAFQYCDGETLVARLKLDCNDPNVQRLLSESKEINNARKALRPHLCVAKQNMKMLCKKVHHCHQVEDSVALEKARQDLFTVRAEMQTLNSKAKEIRLQLNSFQR